MMDNPLWLLVIVAAVILIAHYWTLSRELRRENALFADLAARWGLDFVPATIAAGARLEGRLRGVRILSYSEDHDGNGRRNRPPQQNLAFVDSRAVPRELVIESRVRHIIPFFALLAALRPRKKAVKVGIPEIDHVFVVRGLSAQRARSFLTRPGVLEALFAARRTCPGFRLDGPMLMAFRVSPRRAANAEHSTVIEHLVDCALALEQAADAAAKRRAAQDAMSEAAALDRAEPEHVEAAAARSTTSESDDHDEAAHAKTPAW